MFIIFLPTQFALDLQLLGGLWILQTFPAVVFGLYTAWFKAPALLLGWAVGFIGGTMVFYSDRIVTPAGTKLQPLHAFVMGDTKVAIYVGLRRFGRQRDPRGGAGEPSSFHRGPCSRRNSAGTQTPPRMHPRGASRIVAVVDPTRQDQLEDAINEHAERRDRGYFRGHGRRACPGRSSRSVKAGQRAT